MERRWAAAGVLAVGAAALLMSTRASYLTGDSLLYVHAAKTGIDLFHPHHLLHSPGIRAVASVLAPFCASCDVTVAGQVHSIAWAIVALLALFAMVIRISGSAAVALLVAGLLLVSRGFWELSSQATVYVPALGAAALAVAALLWSEGRLVVTLLLALAVLYHQANVLLSIPLVAFLGMRGGFDGLKRAAAVLAAAGGLTLAVYGAAFVATVEAPTVAGFVRYGLSYTSQVCASGHCDPSPATWGSLDNLSAGGVAVAQRSWMWNLVVLPAAVGERVAPLFAAAVLLLYLWTVVRVITTRDQRDLRLLFLAWALPLQLFFTWWVPIYAHAFLLVLLPQLLLAALAATDLRPRLPEVPAIRHALVASACIAVLAVGSVDLALNAVPLQRNADDSYIEAAELHQMAEPGCVFLTSTRVWNNLRYHFDRTAALQAKYPLVYFYEGLPLPARYDFARTTCLIVAAPFASPAYTLEGYFPDGANGYSRRERWLAYVDWLFDLEADAAGRVVSGRAFDVITLSEGDPYIRLHAFRQPIAGLQDLLDQLDQQLSARQPSYAGLFHAWGKAI